MIYDRIEALLRGEFQPEPERIAWAKAVVGDDALRSFTRCFIEPRNDSGRAPVSASSHFYCARNLYYDLTGADKGDVAPRARLVFHLGDNVETMAVALSILAGVPVLTPKADGRQRVVEIDVRGDTLPGHVDMTIDYMGAETPVEVKSMNEYGWEKSKADGVENTFGYLDQLQFYMRALGAPRGFFLGVNKSTGHTFEQEVKADPAAFARIEAAYAHAKEHQAGGRVPERPAFAVVKQIAGTEQIDAVRCSYCAHREVCWPGYEMKVVSGKPVYRKPVATAEAR
jgi:hypothetical protein